jgi:hypothetical protein
MWAPLALAASVVLVVFALLIVRTMVQQPTLMAFRSTNDLPKSLHGAPISRTTLVRFRGGDTWTTVYVPVDGVIEVRLLPNLVGDASEYSLHATSESPDRENPLIINDLKTADDGYLHVYFPARQMIGHTWLITLGALGAQTESQSVQEFRVQFTAVSAPST